MLFNQFPVDQTVASIHTLVKQSGTISGTWHFNNLYVINGCAIDQLGSLGMANNNKKTDASHEKRQLMIKLHGSVFIDNTARRETARARENARNTPNSCQRK